MKLYATITSERASKGQGGNQFLEIELKAIDKEIPIGWIVLNYYNDIKENKCDCDEVVLKWVENKTGEIRYPQGIDADIIFQTNVNYKQKGKRQKGGYCDQCMCTPCQQL